MKLLHNAIILGLTGLVFSGLGDTAQAAMIRVTVNGSVTSTNMTAFSVGQTMAVAFTYDSTVTPQLVANLQGFFVNPFSDVRLTIGSYDSAYSGHFGQINMYDNLGSTDGLAFQFSQNPAGYQFTNPKPGGVTLASVFSNNLTQTFGELRVNLGSASNSVLNGFVLPVSYNMNDYTANHIMLLGFSDGGVQAGFGSISVQDVTPAPEPGTWLMLATGLAGFVVLRRFRSASFSMIRAGTAKAKR